MPACSHTTPFQVSSASAPRQAKPVPVSATCWPGLAAPGSTRSTGPSDGSGVGVGPGVGVGVTLPPRSTVNVAVARRSAAGPQDASTGCGPGTASAGTVTLSSKLLSDGRTRPSSRCSQRSTTGSSAGQANPVPRAVNGRPTGPLAGVRARVCGVPGSTTKSLATVSVVVAARPGAPGAGVSGCGEAGERTIGQEATTRCGPGSAFAGTSTNPWIRPFASSGAGPAGVLSQNSCAVAGGDFGPVRQLVNPVPSTVTLVSGGPWSGDSVIEACVHAVGASSAHSSATTAPSSTEARTRPTARPEPADTADRLPVGPAGPGPVHRGPGGAGGAVGFVLG